jgi:hypothetical protein
MMRAGWQGKRDRIPTSAYRSADWHAGRYGRNCRSFFVPEAKCQALVLGCQAPELQKTFKVLGCRFKVFASNLEPRTLNMLWWRK